MVKLLIIADDFTGALDTGVQFSSKGISTYVMIGSKIDFNHIEEDTEVLVIDAETRHLDKNIAYEIVFSIVRQAKDKKISYIFKKTDSALRGNIGSEIVASLEASGEKRIHFIPAFPQINRITKRGVHYIDEIPVAQSVFGKDPFEPVKYSNVQDIINTQCDFSSKLVENYISEDVFTDEGIMIYDASSNEDIKNIVDVLVKKDEMHLIAGCAGFASVLPEILKLKERKIKIPKINPKLLIACGSVNPVSVNQCLDAKNKGIPYFRLEPEQKLNTHWIDDNSSNNILNEIYQHSKNNNVVIIDTNDNINDESTIIYSKKIGLSTDEMRKNITMTMGKILKYLIDKGVDNTIFIMGGDSLMGFAKQANINVISPVCEMESGVVLSKLNYNGRTLNVISKSGGFGEKTLFSDLSEMLLRINDGKEELIC